jgi:hypothetical protein
MSNEHDATIGEIKNAILDDDTNFLSERKFSEAGYINYNN